MHLHWDPITTQLSNDRTWVGKNVFCNYLCFGWQPALGGEYKENNASVLFPNNIYGKVLVKVE